MPAGGERRHRSLHGADRVEDVHRATRVDAGAASATIPEARIDDAVTRILRVKLRAGLFEKGRPSSRPLANQRALDRRARAPRGGARGGAQIARAAQEQRTACCRSSRNLKVLVAGDGADNIRKQCGGWTITWQGTENTNADFPGATSIFQGIRAAVEAARRHGDARASTAHSSQRDRTSRSWCSAKNPYAEWFGDLKSIDYHRGAGGDPRLALLADNAAGIRARRLVFLTGRPLWISPSSTLRTPSSSPGCPAPKAAASRTCCSARPTAAELRLHRQAVVLVAARRRADDAQPPRPELRPALPVRVRPAVLMGY